MTDQRLHALLEEGGDADQVLDQLMGLLGDVLHCDRSLLFLRDPHTKKMKLTHGWASSSEYALAPDDGDWQIEPASLPKEDPMYAEALINPKSAVY